MALISKVAVATLSVGSLYSWLTHDPNLEVPTVQVLPSVVGVTPFVQSAPSSETPAPANFLSPSNPSQVSASFQLLTDAQLSALTQDEAFDYLWQFRLSHQQAEDFAAQEYELFTKVLADTPFAAFDYLLAIGLNDEKDFYYQLLFNDFVVHQGRGDELAAYLNTFGPHPVLLSLLRHSGQTELLDASHQNQILEEYLLGNLEYHQSLKSTGWLSRLTPDQRLLALSRATPALVEQPETVLSDALALPIIGYESVFERFLMEHPERFTVYRLVRNHPELNFTAAIESMLRGFDSFPEEEQIELALIGLDYGFLPGFDLLLSLAQSPNGRVPPTPIEYRLLASVDAPPYVEKSLTWLAKQRDQLNFNPFTRRFELY